MNLKPIRAKRCDLSLEHETEPCELCEPLQMKPNRESQANRAGRSGSWLVVAGSIRPELVNVIPIDDR